MKRRFRHIRQQFSVAPNDIISHIGLAGTYSMMGREKEARAEAAEVLRINPKFSLDGYAKRLHHLWINREEIELSIICEKLA